MPRHAFRSLVFAVIFALPTAARATPIDDFKLIGEGHTITYSLPASTAPTPDHPHFISFDASSVTTIDGVAATEGGTYFFSPSFHISLELEVANTVYPAGVVALYLYGPSYFSVTSIPANNPYPDYQDDLYATFIPGTYTLESLTQQLNSQSPRVFYTLTITPETPTSLTPEPSTLALLGTGLLGLLGIVQRRSTGLIKP